MCPTQPIPTSEVLKADGDSVLGCFAWRVHRLLFEAPPLQPADHKGVAGLLVVASVFSANMALSSVSVPREMGLPRTQAWLPAAGYLDTELFTPVSGTGLFQPKDL